MNKVLYPGSFDPITKGHMNIIDQASNLFDEVVVLVANNSSKKNSFFTPEERVKIINETLIDIEKEYQTRASIVMMMNYYLNDNYWYFEHVLKYEDEELLKNVQEFKNIISEHFQINKEKVFLVSRTKTRLRNNTKNTEIHEEVL